MIKRIENLMNLSEVLGNSGSLEEKRLVLEAIYINASKIRSQVRADLLLCDKQLESLNKRFEK